MAGSSITERGCEVEGAFTGAFNLRMDGTDSSTNLDVQHFDILFPNIIFAALLHCFRNIYESATGSKLRRVDDRVEWSAALSSGYP